MKSLDSTGWEDRLGLDLFRNLIAEECRVISEKTGEAERAADEENTPHLSPPPAGSALSFLPLSEGGGPAASTLLFHAGRLFLVGPTTNAVRRILDHGDRIPVPRHVALLSWDADHANGLANMIAADLGSGLTIWTSDWIWEEFFRWAVDNRRDIDLLRFEVISANSLKSSSYENSGPQRSFVVVFGRNLDLTLTSGVRLKAQYVPAPQPSLAMTFECSYLRVDLDPWGVAARVDMEEVGDSVIQRLVQEPAVRRMAMVRYGELKTGRKSLPVPKPRGMSDSWLVPEPPLEWLIPEPVDLSSVNKSKKDIQFVAKPPESPLEKPIEIAQSSSDLDTSTSTTLSSCAIMILCGGLRGNTRDLVGPNRVFNAAVSGDKQRMLTVIEWWLQRLRALARKYNVTGVPVLLMVSPETEPLVRYLVSRYSGEPLPTDAMEVKTESLNIAILPQSLVPIMREDSGGLKPLEERDGGWRLTSAGHLDAVQLLWHWSKSKVAGGRESCVLFAHNNFGAVVSADTMGYAEEFAARQSLFGFESFPLERSSGDGDSRWDLMSFTVNDMGPRLYRSGAYPPPGEFARRCYSSMTWYVNLNLLRKLKLGTILQTKYVVSPPPGDGTGDPKDYRLHRDLDQLTHCPGIRCVEMRFPVPHSPGVYGDSRFVTARDEGHIRSKDFRDAFERVLAVEPLRSEEPGVTPPDKSFLVLPLEPAKMNYVWGGVEIPRRKGQLNYWESRTAETWEVSTHPAGPSSVHLNLRRSVPLTDVVGSLDYMAKYLDCQGPLSIQVHPSKKTAEYLSKNAPSLGLKDSWGKEESFLVLSAAPSGNNLIFGFDRERISPLAQMLHPVIVKGGADWERKGLDAFLKDLAEKMGEAAWEHILGPVLDSEKGKLRPCEQDLRAACDVAFSMENADPNLGDLSSILRYHTHHLPIEVTSAGPPLSIFGKEYLLAAVAFIRTIQCLVKFADGRMDKAEGAGLKEMLKCPSYQWAHSPIYRFFYATRVEPGYWVRVPPGVVHAWQGGGNFLIELADRSDNTFRILDYARELTEDKRERRDMHYRAAMYAISEESVITQDSKRRLIFETARDGEGRCHAKLDYRFLRKSPRMVVGSSHTSRTDGEPQATEITKPSDRKASEDYSVLLNPDNPVEINARGPKGAVQLTLPPAGGALVGKGVSLSVTPYQASDRVLHIMSRPGYPDLLCVSLAVSKVELALWRDDASPLIVWQKIPVSAWDSEHEDARQPLRRLREIMAKEIPEAVAKWSRPEHPARVAISWPGPIKSQGGTATLFSTVWGELKLDEMQYLVSEALHKVEWRFQEPVQVKTGVAAGVSGENMHPLGGLPGKEPGLLLNIGSGVGAGLLPKPAGEAALSAVGRWLYYYTRKGTFGRHPKKGGDIESAVFSRAVPYEDDEWIRASEYFSSAGIVVRFLMRLSLRQRERFLKQCQWADDPLDAGPSFSERYLRIHRAPGAYNRHRFISEFNGAASGTTSLGADLKGIARAFTIEAGHQIASLLEALRKDALTEGCRASFGRIVLSGSVGEHFGRLQSEDLLLDVMQQQLPECGLLKRSEIAVSCHRELAGFLDGDDPYRKSEEQQ